MKKKIIIAGTVLVVLVGGIGIKVVHSHIENQATHTSTNHEYNNSESEKDDTTSELIDGLPSRDEVNTTPDSIFCLVNKEYSLPSDYEPNDLVVPDVSFNIDYESEKRYMREEAALALESLCQDALSEGLEIFAISGYRSYERQQEIYENNLKTRGTTHTNQYSAKPGYSEHQTGLVMDVSCESEGFDLQESFGETPEGIWLAQNCAKYGFVIRYPEGKENITGYAYEPWHIRYLGVELATYLTENNLTLDEYYYYEPSFEFITDESEYINDTPSYSSDSSTSYTPIYSPTPSASTDTNYNQTNSGNTYNENSNTSSSTSTPATTVSPVNPSPSVEPSISPTPETPEVDPEEPEESAPVATETTTPSPSPSANTTPSVAPSHTAPSPSPSASVPSTEPQPDDSEEESATSETETIIE